MPKILLDSSDIERAVTRMAHEIVEKNRGGESLCLIGIQRGGVGFAFRLSSKLREIEGVEIPTGALDITFYRDDINVRKDRPSASKTEIPFEFNNKKVVLVDDVLFTGRSIRAAMDALMDFGRPGAIQLAVLVDRGHRELPIKADFVGKNIPTSMDEKVSVYLAEKPDPQDRVELK